MIAAVKAGYVHKGCGGVWEPCPGWVARYRCCNCWALGLRERLVTASRAATGDVSAYGRISIRPYLCARRVKGKSCGRVATRRVRKVCYCAEHAPETS